MTDEPMTEEPTVVLHVSDRPEDIIRAIGTARTLHEKRPSYRLRIIVNGPAVQGATRGADAIAVPDFVAVDVCEVALRGRGIPLGDVQEGLGTVASAAVALVDAQVAGAAYIRV